ncbi:MAG: type II toxin-antitoxin system RelE/ParE family toxin [Gammaproteobacteria bacterium]|nr:type II toxin-antitoxin system RelE/ParE family toxin [Gammaproteobacteria bacterium]
MKIYWTHLAQNRVAEIARYIAQDNLAAARNWVEKIFAKVDKLSQFPEMGRNVSEIKKSNIRELIYGNYRIIYRGEKQLIYILTVRHFAQILPVNEVK